MEVGPPIESMQVTAAHEYNHILQFNYDLFEQVWMYESTATWVEVVTTAHRVGLRSHIADGGGHVGS